MLCPAVSPRFNLCEASHVGGCILVTVSVTLSCCASTPKVICLRGLPLIFNMIKTSNFRLQDGCYQRGFFFFFFVLLLAYQAFNQFPRGPFLLNGIVRCRSLFIVSFLKIVFYCHLYNLIFFHLKLFTYYLLNGVQCQLVNLKRISTHNFIYLIVRVKILQTLFRGIFRLYYSNIYIILILKRLTDVLFKRKLISHLDI